MNAESSDVVVSRMTAVETIAGLLHLERKHDGEMGVCSTCLYEANRIVDAWRAR